MGDFNQEQSKGLAGFFFDLAKGLALGGVGLSLNIPGQARMLLLFLALIGTVVCVRLALGFLGRFNDF